MEVYLYLHNNCQILTNSVKNDKIVVVLETLLNV